ncbi:MAG: RNA-binding protein [Rubricella sp.]
MARGGRKAEREGPERRCIARGESGATDLLIRFVVGPDGAIVPDLAERLPGRGIWLSADRAAFDLAERKKLFSRAARMQVSVPVGLADLVEELLARRLVELIALARKGGHAVAGFLKTDQRLRAGPVGALIEAVDGSEGQRRKLRPLKGDAPVIAVLNAEELGVAFGRDHVIHAALDEGGLTEKVLRDARRLEGLRIRGQEAGAADEAAEPAPDPVDDDSRDGPGGKGK